ncbi:MAG: hypothetical protein HY017_03665 [Betaproteobacteria bacterium]|nr:hypothetical protein [Betaproteobacteria bacterium]
MRPMRFSMTPPRAFALSSLMLIAATAAVTSFTQSSFFRQAIIEREAKIIRDIATAVVREDVLEHQLSSSDIDRYTEAEAQFVSASFFL